MTKKKITKAYARKNNLVRDYEIDEKKLRKIDIHKMPKRLEKLFARAFAFSPDYLS